MADEIAQVCQLEIQGMTFVVKGTVQVAAFLGKAFKALFEWSKERRFERPGERTAKDIMKMSEGGPAQISDIPKECYTEVLSEMDRLGLHHAVVIDNDITDGMTPIMVPYQEAALVAEILKNIIIKHETEQKEKLSDVNKALAESKEKLLNCDPEEKNALDTLIENLEQCQMEMNQLINRNENIIKNGSTVSFNEYLASFKGTDFEKNPDMAKTELNHGVEIGKSFPASACMQPIRNPELIPETSCYYYLPERGVTVTRNFATEQETGLAYSNYSLKTKDGQLYEFSDKNMTKSEWNEKELPQLLDKAEILEGTLCRVFTYEERMLAYAKIHGNVKSDAEIRVENKTTAGQEVFSSADVSKEIQNAVSELLKGMTSAKAENDNIVISVPANDVFIEQGKLKVNLDDHTTALFSNIKGRGAKDGFVTFSIKNSESVEVGIKDSKSEDISYSKYSATGIKKLIDEKQNIAVNELSKSASR